MSIFRFHKQESAKGLDHLQTNIELQRIQAAYQSLQSQYDDARKTIDLSRKIENEVVAYLKDLELMLANYATPRRVREKNAKGKTQEYC